MSNNLKRLEQKAKRKSQSRENKKKPKMKVSGKGVFKLQKLIRKQSK